MEKKFHEGEVIRASKKQEGTFGNIDLIPTSHTQREKHVTHTHTHQLLQFKPTERSAPHGGKFAA